MCLSDDSRYEIYRNPKTDEINKITVTRTWKEKYDLTKPVEIRTDYYYVNGRRYYEFEKGVDNHSGIKSGYLRSDKRYYYDSDGKISLIVLLGKEYEYIYAGDDNEEELAQLVKDNAENEQYLRKKGIIKDYSWKKVYRDFFVEEVKNHPEIKEQSIGLLYINDDDIPEFYYRYDDVYAGYENVFLTSDGKKIGELRINYYYS